MALNHVDATLWRKNRFSSPAANLQVRKRGMISLKLSIDNFGALLLLRARERMNTQFAAERVTNLRDNLDLRRMIIFRVLKLLHGMLVIDRVGPEDGSDYSHRRRADLR